MGQLMTTPAPLITVNVSQNYCVVESDNRNPQAVKAEVINRWVGIISRTASYQGTKLTEEYAIKEGMITKPSQNEARVSSAAQKIFQPKNQSNSHIQQPRSKSS